MRFRMKIGLSLLYLRIRIKHLSNSILMQIISSFLMNLIKNSQWKDKLVDSSKSLRFHLLSNKNTKEELLISILWRCQLQVQCFNQSLFNQDNNSEGQTACTLQCIRKINLFRFQFTNR